MAAAKLSFHSADRAINIPNRKILKKQIAALFTTEKIDLGELKVIFCSDRFLLKINRDHLHHNYLTDVITFTYSAIPVVGEIYISTDRIRENALKFRNSISNETARVIFHGALHLCGYKDKTSNQRSKMSFLEDLYLRKWEKAVSRETKN